MISVILCYETDTNNGGGKMRMLSLFSGIGGIDLAAQWAGIETVAFCEIDPFCQKVLKKHWPEVAIFDDVTKLSASSLQHAGIQTESIDIVTGGFPCQPHSISGKRLASNDERDLWGENRRIISEINPRWYLGENVPGLLSSESGRFFGRVLRDLAEMGYTAGWLCFGADTTGSVQGGERVYIVAASDSVRRSRPLSGFEQTKKIYEARTSIKMAADRTSGYAYQGRIWPAAPGIRRVADGIPYRVDRLRVIGNAVDPRQIYPILAAIAEIEKGS